MGFRSKFEIIKVGDRFHYGTDYIEVLWTYILMNK